MKLAPTLVAAALLAVGLVAVAPPASATTCTFGEPTLEPLVCGIVLAPFCVGENHDAPKYLPRCVTRLVLP